MLLLIREKIQRKRNLRIQELERLLVRSEIARDQLIAGIRLDTNARYAIFTDDEELKQVLPDNVLKLSSCWKQLDLAYCLETMPKEERSKLELWLLNGVMKAPVLSDLITVHGDSIAVGGRKLTAAEITQIRSEVKVLKKMRVTRLLDETINENARKVMFENAKSLEDMKFGKIIFYMQDLKENVFKIILKQTLDEKMKKVVHLSQ